MNGFWIANYVSEIINQCDNADVALEMLHTSVEEINDVVVKKPDSPPIEVRSEIRNRAVTRGFAAVQFLLGSAGMVSKLLFVTKGASPVTRDRARAVRDVLGIEDVPVLSQREVRNSFEHVDERMDDFLAAGNTYLVDKIWGNFTSDVNGEPAKIIRHVDPDADAVRVVSKDLEMVQISISELAEALSEVKRRAVAWRNAYPLAVFDDGSSPA